MFFFKKSALRIQLRHKSRAQSVVEYVLLLGIIAAVSVTVMRAVKSEFATNWNKNKGLQANVMRSYRNGHITARGLEAKGEAPKRHPRIAYGSNGSFHLFKRQETE